MSDIEYLQQHLVAEARPQGDTSAWSQERRSLMDQIDALKDLLQQADKVAKQVCLGSDYIVAFWDHKKIRPFQKTKN